MAKVLNFNAIKRQSFRVILADENETAVDVVVPTKEMITRLFETYKTLSTITPDEYETCDVVSELYNIATELLSCNRQGMTFTVETVRKMWSIEDVVLFSRTYIEFINEITKSKN